MLKSWAVPKGPSTDPADKRLAVEVEDHPLDYANFEGIIPEGNYGAGSVIVWDRGTYRNLMGEKEKPLSLEASIHKGHVEIWLEGEKLRGGFVLIRTPREASKPQWLLMKMKDEFAGKKIPARTAARSVVSGRTLADIESGDESEGE